MPRYNARFASPIDYSRNYFISVPKDFDSNSKLATWEKQKILNGCYVSINGKYYIVKQDGKAIYTASQDRFSIYLNLDGTRHLYYDGKICNLELVPQKLVKPKITKIVKPTAIKTMEGKANEGNTKKNINSPWRNYNPNFINRDRAEWRSKNVIRPKYTKLAQSKIRHYVKNKLTKATF